MPEVRIVFSDLDDTFLARDKSIPAENMAALVRLAERGVPFVPCTGRSFLAIPEVLRTHPATRLSVACSGAVAYDRAGSVVWHRAVGRERALALFEAVRDLDVSFDVFADGSVFAERTRYERMRGYGIDPTLLSLILSSRTPVDLDVPRILESTSLVERLGIFWRDGEAGADDSRRVKAAVESIPGMRWTSSSRFGIEIVDEEASKGEALAWVCAELGVPQKCSVAFGDSPNDLEMLRAAGVGVAMGNASSEVKAASDDVCATCDEAGVSGWLSARL